MSERETLARKFEKRGIRLETGPGDLTSVVLEHEGASVRVCMHGAHVLDYRPRGQEPVLWLSPGAIFAPTKAIRGGIPICWPWFAEHPLNSSLPAHGFARTAAWRLFESLSSDEEKAITLSLHDDATTRKLWPNQFALRYRVSVSDVLDATLSVTNTGDANMDFTAALHSYFNVADIGQVSLEGLAGCRYLDKVNGNARKLQSEPLLRIEDEVDRTYLDTEGDCVIHDDGRGRQIRIRKSGSRTTVVWNPWLGRARQLADFPDDAYRGMLCVETANAANDVIHLAPGAAHTLSASIACIADDTNGQSD